jgi:HlyD family secretion protein
VRIVTFSEDGGLRIPVSAGLPLPGGDGTSLPASAVFVVDQARARPQPVTVTVAARNGSIALLRKGLSPGATVIIYPPATVTDGARVKVHEVYRDPMLGSSRRCVGVACVPL